MNVPTCFVDTNVFVRYLTADDKRKAKAVEKLLLKAKNGAVKLTTSDLVIAELVWVLSSFYELSNTMIADLLRAILNTDGLKVENAELLEGAVEIFEAEEMDFIDACIVRYMRLKGIKTLYSYDKKHLSKIADIERVQP